MEEFEISWTQDFTDEAIALIKETVKEMPGNEGQEKLVHDLKYYARLVVEFTLTFDPPVDLELDVRILSEYIYILSNHPEAIEEIIDRGYEVWYAFVDYLQDLQFGGGEIADVFESLANLLNQDNRRRLRESYIPVIGSFG